MPSLIYNRFMFAGSKGCGLDGPQTCSEPKLRHDSIRSATVRGMLLVLFSALLGVPAFARDRWVCATSQNFRVFGHTSTKQATELLIRLERFRKIVGELNGSMTPMSVPIDVFLFKDRAAFEPYLPIIGGEKARVAGYFSEARPRSLIAMSLDRDSAATVRVILHEFTHFLTRERNWPLWLNEGVAEFYSTFRLQNREVTLGLPIESHVRSLRAGRLIPVDRLIEMDPRAVGYSDRQRSESFYSEAWILFHFLRMADDADLTARLKSYIARLAAGQDPVTSFHIVFDPVPIEQSVREYFRASTIPLLKIKLKSSDLSSKVTSRSITRAEVLARSVELLLRRDNLDNAGRLLEQAERDNAPRGIVAMMKGMLAYRGSRWAEAAQHFEDAVRVGPDDFLAHYYLALATGNALSSGSGLNRTDAEGIASHLERSVTLRPQFVDGYERLADFHLQTGIDIGQGLRAGARGLKLDPANHGLALTLARLQLRNHDEPAARALLERLVAPGIDPGVRRESKSLLEILDTGLAAHDADDRTEEASTAKRVWISEQRPYIARDHPPESDSPLERAPVRTCQPDFVNVRSADSVYGTLEEIRCEKGRATYVIAADDGTTRLLDAPLDAPVLFSCSVKLENLTCGPIGSPVLAYYAEAPALPPGYVRAVAIEVTTGQNEPGTGLDTESQ